MPLKRRKQNFTWFDCGKRVTKLERVLSEKAVLLGFFYSHRLLYRFFKTILSRNFYSSLWEYFNCFAPNFPMVQIPDASCFRSKVIQAFFWPTQLGHTIAINIYNICSFGIMCIGVEVIVGVH